MEQFQKWPVLSEVNSPKDLKALDRKGLATLAREIREYLVYRVGENGGHLASNLGVVELTMAIHRVFDVPRDHLIFDVGHQSYVHKLLTERKDRFDTLRQAGGISGFTRREESAYDAFGAGHSSTAISAAIGMAEADRLAGRDCYTIAVVGDGALTGGLAYEGMNNCRRDLKLIIIINENEMSISPNTGRFAEYLSHVRTSPSYIRTKAFTKSALRHIPLFGKPLHRLAGAVKRTIKRRFYRRNMFEYMGAHFLGPMDGNDLDGMIACLSYAQKLSGSIILHVKTQKGRGYAPAEKDPNRYHGLPPKEPPPAAPTKLSEEMGRALCDLASRDGRICAITAAMSDGTGLTPFREAYPQRFYDVGIAEGHAVTFAAGLAAGGMRPVVALYSTFLQRAYDNILHDAALQGLPVTLCIDRAGLNPFDGVTHHGIYDVAMLSSLSGVSIYAPVTARGIKASLRAAQESGGVSAIRYSARGEDPAVMAAFYGGSESDDTPRVRVWQSGRGAAALTVITHGKVAAMALQMATLPQFSGITVRVLLCEYLAPYDKLAAEVAALLGEGNVIFYEGEVRAGGFGMNLCDALTRRGALEGRHTRIVAIDDGFSSPAKGESVYRAAGVDCEALALAAAELQREKETNHDQN